ncbi:hypothetical protein M5C99_05360 [Acidovorax sp. NCPPB 2350]|nr:hypothetical protein M5C99_05360 [Acidovorax sp. NCPPB 2350]
MEESAPRPTLARLRPIVRRNPAPVPLGEVGGATSPGTARTGGPSSAEAAIARDDIPVDYRPQSASMANRRPLTSGPAIGRDDIRMDHHAQAESDREAAWQDVFDPEASGRLGMTDAAVDETLSPWRSPLHGASASAPPPLADTTPEPLKRIDLRDQPHATIASLPEREIRSLAAACRLPHGASVSTAQVAQHLREHLGRMDFDVFSRYDRVNVLNMDRTSLLRTLLPSQQRYLLSNLANKTHMTIRQEQVDVPGRSEPVHRIGIYFDGLPYHAERQNGTTLKGGVGQVYRMACEIAVMIAEAIRDRSDVEVSPICGLSMGGGSAQMFAATLQSHAPRLPPPALTLLDPMLLNRAQRAHAIAGAPHPYDFKEPRGVAISLDYAADPRKSLMDRLQGVGFSTAGLVRLRLGLTDEDGEHRTQPKPYGPPGTGYHANRHHYTSALERFLGPGGPSRR